MESFMPHIHCYLGDQALIWTMVVTDSLIALAYLAISANLYNLVRKVQLPLSTMFVAFGTFILACGATHAMEVYNIWVPDYWLSAGVKVITAIASVATAIWVFPVKRVVVKKLMEARALQTDLAHRVEKRTQELEQAIKARDQFLSIASHELKTPLTSLKLQLELLHKRLASNGPKEKLDQGVKLSVSQVNRLTVLVEDLLDVGRMQAGRLLIHGEKVDLSEAIRTAVEQFSEFAQRENCKFDLQLQDGIVGFWDYSRIEQVLANLISNAIKYAPGTLITIRAQMSEGMAEIMVQDRGPGIVRERQSQIFERFERATSSRSISGLGLGLFIV